MHQKLFSMYTLLIESSTFFSPLELHTFKKNMQMHKKLDSSNNKTVIDVFNITITIINNFTGRKLFYAGTKTIMVVPITDPKFENKNILIYKQVLMKNVYCVSIIGRVQNGKVVISVLNITEPKKTVDKFNLNKLLYDDDIELCSTRTINIEKAVGSRLGKTKEIIHTEHMNNEKTLCELCKKYAEIFHLDE